MKRDLGARWMRTGLTLLCAMLVLAFLAGGMGGCATLKTMTPQEAHVEAGGALEIASVVIGGLYVTGAVDAEEFAALEGLLEEAQELHGLVGVTLEALEDAKRAGSAVEAMVSYQEAALKSKTILNKLNVLIQKLK